MSSSGHTPLVFPLPPLDSAWEHPAFPPPEMPRITKPPPTPVPPALPLPSNGQAPPQPPIVTPGASRPLDVIAALVIDLAVLGLLGYLVSRGHLRLDFAGVMAVVGLVLHHRRAAPVLPTLFRR